MTDETGAPVAGANVRVHILDGSAEATTKADSDGRYEVTVIAKGLSPWRPEPLSNLVGVILASDPSHQLEFNYQHLLAGSEKVVTNLRLRKTRRIEVGDSIAVAVEPDSSLCTDVAANYYFTSRCEYVRVASNVRGIVTVEAVPETGANQATVHTFFEPWVSGTTRIEFAIEAGKTNLISIEVPIGVPTQRYRLTTSIQSTAGGVSQR